jgi:Transposase DDE domain
VLQKFFCITDCKLSELYVRDRMIIGGLHHTPMNSQPTSVPIADMGGTEGSHLPKCRSTQKFLQLRQGRLGKQDFVYLPEQDAYRCPAGERLPYRYTNEEAGKTLRRYWTNACQNCSLKSQCTTGSERRMMRWEHEHLLEAVKQRLGANPLAMRQRRETVEHPFGTMRARMGATHFLTGRLDGSFGSSLQPDASYEHRRDQAAGGCDRCLRPNRSWPLKLTSI